MKTEHSFAKQVTINSHQITLTQTNNAHLIYYLKKQLLLDTCRLS